jgi:hypothetical protein
MNGSYIQPGMQPPPYHPTANGRRLSMSILQKISLLAVILQRVQQLPILALIDLGVSRMNKHNPTLFKSKKGTRL